MNKNIISLWLIPKDAQLKPISDQEIKWKNKLSYYQSKQYEHSRGYVREALSKILEIPPLDIPIVSPPGSPPKLPPEMGHVSFSHCWDRLLIAWSSENIGVDIERSDRLFEAKKILNKFFALSEKKFLKDLKDLQLHNEVLKLWVRKEAAIKWQKGSIFNDLSQWTSKLGSDKIEHKDAGYNLRSFFLNYEDWYISVACNIYSEKENLIICKY